MESYPSVYHVNFQVWITYICNKTQCYVLLEIIWALLFFLWVLSFFSLCVCVCFGVGVGDVLDYCSYLNDLQRGEGCLHVA